MGRKSDHTPLVPEILLNDQWRYIFAYRKPDVLPLIKITSSKVSERIWHYHLAWKKK